MKVKYFQDTDTLYIEFRTGGIVATKDLGENTQLDIDAEGNITERDEIVHLISARKATRREQREYEEGKDQEDRTRSGRN